MSTNYLWDVFHQSAAPKYTAVVFTEHVNATYILSFHHALQHAGWHFCAMSQNTSKALSIKEIVAAVDQLRPTIVFFSRWGHSNGIELMRGLILNGHRCVYHIDDDLLNLPDSLGAGVLATHGSPEVLNTRRTMLKEAHTVYASTAQLRSRLQSYFPDANIYSGIYAPTLQTHHYEPQKPFKIGYMGSKGHKEDLEIALPAIERILADRTDVHFSTFGTIQLPERLKEFGSRYTHIPVEQNYTAFISKLSTLRWDIGLAPLADIPFNQCKAPTKFVEYTGAGIPTIASDVNVYQKVVGERNGWLCGDEDWYDAMEHVIENSDESIEFHRNAQEYTKNCFSLQILAKQITDLTVKITK